MPVRVILIMMVLMNRRVDIIGTNSLPSFYLDNNLPLDSQLRNFLKDNYDLVYDWLDLKYMDPKIIDGELHLYYNTFVPKDFINDLEFISDTGSLPLEDKLAIGQAIRIHPANN
jgi:hypothetical protein